MLKLLSIICVAALLPQSEGGGGPSEIPIAITPPNFAGGVIANDAPPGPFFVDFQPPFPTDAWWSGFTVSNQDADVAGPFPFMSSTSLEGFKFGIGDNREFDGTSIKVPTQRDWTASIANMPQVITNRKCTYFDTQAVCLQYMSGGETMDTCLLPGSPYITLVYKNAGIVLQSGGGAIKFSWITPGEKAKATTPFGGTYVIYVTGLNVELTANETHIVSGPGTTATLRIAKIQDPAQEAVLDAHKGTYPTGLDFRYAVAGDTATLTWTWDVVGNADELLMLSWHHHRVQLQTPDFVNIEYLTLKGPMRGVRGNVWNLKYDLPTINWFAENDVHPSCLVELEKTLEFDVAALHEMNPGDFYFWGGSVGRAARLALIAEHIGKDELIPEIVAVLKASIDHWFDPTHVPAAAYETGWGGLINREGWNNSWVDFGNAYYNDHHFHYGYILEAAAVIGKYEPAWLQTNIDFFTHIARDVGNPSPNDPHHYVVRHMDWFAGHSWASGIHNGAGGRDQESTGEAINGYYGLLLFAHATNNQALIDWSRILLAIETRGAQEYWHLYPNAPADATTYPEQAFRELITIGNVMDSQAGAWLFWGGQRIQISAIQILPLTPIGQVYYDKEWVDNLVPYCKEELDDPSLGDEFKCLIYAAHAVVNPQEAYMYSSRLIDWGSGNSASNQLYFIATQSSTTDICTAAAQTPEGVYNIQDADSGLFLTEEQYGQLTATTDADVLAGKFNLGFKPGGGTIQSLSSHMYVSASPTAEQPLAASRETPEGYETFRWNLQEDGTYTVTAMVNKADVSTGVDGKLINNVNSTQGVSGRYKITLADTSPPIVPPASGTIQSMSNNRFVISTPGAPNLMTTEASAATATRFAFARIPESDDDAPLYSIQNLVTEQFVTGNGEGTAPLSSTSPAPQAWEHFRLVGYQNGYILIHAVSGHAVSAQADNTMIDDTTSITQGALWQITL